MVNEFTRFLGALTARNVRYVVCGGVACIMHGVERTTADLDLVLDMDPDNLARLVEVAKAHSLQPRVPESIDAILDDAKRRDWIENKNAKVFTLVSTQSTLQVDVMLTYPVQFEDLWRDAEQKQVNDLRFRVSSKPHLIRAKQLVDPLRKQDQRDIEDLKELIERERA
jgi:protein-tyrosine-phosphatase